MKNKISYEIKSANATSASSEMVNKIKKEANEKNAAYVLVKKEGAKEKIVFSSKLKSECETEKKRLEKQL